MLLLLTAACALKPPAASVLSRRCFLFSTTAASGSLAYTRPAVAAVPVGEREETTTCVIAVPGREPVGVPRQRYTGAGDSSWIYQEKPLPLFSPDTFPDSWPYTLADFQRIDEDPDTRFYRIPKLVYHIDEGAVCALMRYYDKHISDDSDVLDICSSWISHYPPDFPSRMRSISGTGISALELACNDQFKPAGSFKQADLNVKPVLPYPDRSMDVVTCVVSFDYLTKPLEVMREIARVLRPGGKLILSQSNRFFFTKAVSVWTTDVNDESHLRVLGNYIHFAGGFEQPRAFDISPRGMGTNDPLFIVEAIKSA